MLFLSVEYSQDTAYILGRYPTNMNLGCDHTQLSKYILFVDTKTFLSKAQFIAWFDSIVCHLSIWETLHLMHIFDPNSIADIFLLSGNILHSSSWFCGYHNNGYLWIVSNISMWNSGSAELKLNTKASLVCNPFQLIRWKDHSVFTF
jgi:hypothetical protein